jgi:predicted RNase H-like HicB family nuclease
MSVDLTAVFEPVPEGFIAFVEELPGVTAQDSTLEEAGINLQEAVALVLQANRDLAEEDLANAIVIRELFRLSA